MGNQLVVSGASVEVNLTDVAEGLTLKAPLGRRKGRLFKALHCYTDDGADIVAKVFLKRYGDIEQVALLKRHKERLDKITTTLHDFRSQNKSNPWNISYYSKILGAPENAREGSCCLMRPYFHSSLQERLLTRPLLSSDQKLFIIYQLLQGVALMGKLKVAHGDLKTENVMVTSTGWVYMTDFAPFKPTFLPAFNPADFTYYFDTAEQRYCCLAPERFYDAGSAPKDLFEPPTEAMDVFSIGCIAAHIMTEDPFLLLPQVLALRKGEFDVADYVRKRVTHDAVARCIISMLQPDPKNRPSAEELIAQFTPSVFPRHFPFLYNNVLTTLKQLPPDMQLTALWSSAKDQVMKAHLCHYYPNFAEAVSKRPVEALPNVSLPEDTSASTPDVVSFQSMITPVVCCALRHTKLRENRIRGLRLLEFWSQYATDDTKLLLFLPHIIMLLHDMTSIVRAEAVRALAYVGGLINNPPSSASKLYEEFVFPELFELRKDTSQLVRAAYSEVLPQIANSARRFLEKRHQGVGTSGTYDAQLNQLRTVVWNHAQELLNDNEMAVAHAMLSGVAILATSLGRDFTNQNLMPMMTTFLSRPTLLRKALFGQLCQLVAYVGPQHAEDMILIVVKSNGLNDLDPLVVCEALSGVTTLTRLGVLSSAAVKDLCEKIVPLMLHPNVLIRKEAIAFVIAIPKCVDGVDILTFVMPIVMPFLEFNVTDLRVLSDIPVVKEPIARAVFQAALNDPEAVPSDNLMKSYYLEASQRVRMNSSLGDKGGIILRGDTYTVRYMRGTDARVKEILWEIDFFAEGLVAAIREVFHPNRRQSRRLAQLAKEPQVRERRGSEFLSAVKREVPEKANAPVRTMSIEAFHPIGGLWCQSEVHTGPITAVASNDSNFVTASGDGTLRLWSVSNVLKQNCLIPRTKFTLPDRAKVLSTSFVTDGDDLAVCAGTDQGHFRTYSVETGQALWVRDEEEGVGGIAAIANMPGTSWALLGTHGGHIIAVDVRQKNTVWSTQMSRQHGAITNLLLGVGAKRECHWMVGGTLNGYIALWDLRYRLNVFTVPLPRPNPTVTALSVQGNQPSVLVCTGGSEVLKMNLEAYTPDMEVRDVASVSQMIVEAYKPSSALGKQSVRSILCIPDTKLFLTGGSDRRIRLWDTADYNNSYTISGLDMPREQQPRYVRVGGSSLGHHQVREELIYSPKPGAAPKGNLERQLEHAAHKDTVTALNFVSTREQSVVVSGSRDGAVKLWALRAQMPHLI